MPDGKLTPSPFLKWAGGKSQLLGELRRVYPDSFNAYYEPFLGGGAVFFDLCSMGKISNAVLNDSNRDLMNLWAAIKENVGGLIEHLDELQKHVKDKSYYLGARKRFSSIPVSEDFARKPNLEKAALFLYLNKTCFNGLYRVNSKGEFNVPFGKYRNPKLYSLKNLMAASNALRDGGRVTLRSEDFGKVLADARKGDFVYFDPPYAPLSETSSFTSYTREGFVQQDQARLSDVFKSLDKKGCKLLLSNSYQEQTFRPLYARYFDEGSVKVVDATRAINSVGNRRGPIKELLITNYGPHRHEAECILKYS